LLIDDFDPEDHRRADVERIQKAGQQATSLVSQLLAFSRKQILNPEIINLNEIITEVSHMLRRLIGEHIEFAARTDPKLDLINADPAQIQQIVMNLAVNARDAMPYGGKLTIETSNVEIDAAYIDNHPAIKPGSYVMLAISDNGIGMDAETKARLFEPFFTTKVKGKGTGLGLSTVYGIVKQSNGYVWVYSELGQGTTFKMYFPCIKARQSNSRLEAQGQSEIIGSETILVVEDEAPVRALTSRILRDRGFTVIEALDGNEALAIADHHSGPIHLVLTDVIMPGISGVSLVSKLETKRAGIKAIYISGYADNAIVHQGILNPDVDFVQKPFSVDKLLAHVKKALNK
jgi:CheY-like chemotaxis protein